MLCPANMNPRWCSTTTRLENFTMNSLMYRPKSVSMSQELRPHTHFWTKMCYFLYREPKSNHIKPVKSYCNISRSNNNCRPTIQITPLSYPQNNRASTSMEDFSHHAKVGVTHQGILLVFHSSLRNGGTRRKIQVIPRSSLQAKSP